VSICGSDFSRTKSWASLPMDTILGFLHEATSHRSNFKVHHLQHLPQIGPWTNSVLWPKARPHHYSRCTRRFDPPALHLSLAGFNTAIFPLVAGSGNTRFKQRSWARLTLQSPVNGDILSLLLQWWELTGMVFGREHAIKPQVRGVTIDHCTIPTVPIGHRHQGPAGRMSSSSGGPPPVSTQCHQFLSLRSSELGKIFALRALED